jgi:hypothetical protein
MVAHTDIPLHVRLSMGLALRGMSGTQFEPHVYKITDEVMRDDWALAHAGPTRICDECSKTMGGEVPTEDIRSLEYFLLFALTTKGIESAFLCEWCSENFEVDGMASIPNVTARLDLITTDAKRQALIALFDLDGKK